MSVPMAVESKPLRVPLGAWLGTLMLLLFVIPALSRLTTANNALAGALAALPFFLTLYSVVILSNGGRIRVAATGVGAAPLIIWALILVLSMARSNNPSHAGGAAFLLAILWAAICISALVLASELLHRDLRITNAVLLGVSAAAGVFVALNLTMYALGVSSPRTLLVDFPEGQMASLLGFRIERTLFPLASGINNFGTVAGLAVAGSLGCALTARLSRLLRVAAFVLFAGAVASLFFTDSRGPLLFGVLSGVGVPLLFRTPFSRALRWLAVIAPVLPPILLLVMSLLARTDVGRALSRQQGDLASATGRTLVWGAAAGKLVASPEVLDVVGYGQYGPRGAGISSAWAAQFKGFMDDPTLISAHNFSLQLIYDVGYVGFLAVLGLFWWAFGVLSRAHATFGLSGCVPVATVLCYVLLAGTTEATLQIGFPEILVLFSTSIAMCLVLRTRLRMLQTGEASI